MDIIGVNKYQEFDSGKMKKMVKGHFFDIFMGDQEIREPIVSFFPYPTYLEDHQVSLCTIPSILEIKKVLFDMSPHKAQDEYGFPTLFYKHYKDIMSSLLHYFVIRVGMTPL